MGSTTEVDAASTSLFARRLAALEQVKNRMVGLRRELAQLLIAERQQKASIYQANMHVGHGERQGIVSAETAQIATEILQLRSDLDVCEDERRFLEFCVTYDVGE